MNGSTKSPRVAIYARVSTEEQSTENQVPVLQQYATSRGWNVLHVYSEEVSAWRAGRQRELKQLLIDASYHKYDIVLVWALDRLTREGPGIQFQLIDSFHRYGAEVFSLQEPWTEQSGPFRDLLSMIMAWVAQQESKRRSERIKAANDKKRAKGERVGRKPGAKDKKPRKRSGYFNRFADRRK